MYAKNLPKAVAVNGRLSRAVFKKTNSTDTFVPHL